MTNTKQTKSSHFQKKKKYIGAIITLCLTHGLCLLQVWNDCKPRANESITPANEGPNPGLNTVWKLDNYQVPFASNPLLLVDKHSNIEASNVATVLTDTNTNWFLTMKRCTMLLHILYELCWPFQMQSLILSCRVALIFLKLQPLLRLFPVHLLNRGMWSPVRSCRLTLDTFFTQIWHQPK